MKKLSIFIMLIFISSSSFAKCISKEPQVLSDVMKILHCLEKEIKVIKSKNNGKSVIVNSFPNTPKATVKKTIQIKNVKVELKKCKRESTSVTCYFNFTNTGKNDRTFHLNYGGVDFYDEKGDSYNLGSSDLGNGNSSRNLLTNIPVEGKITVNDLPEDRTQFSRFSMKTNSGMMKFRNIAIQK